ncbi:hypothetical protein ASD89_00035 [Caulobacter sp. Root656]|nr:hypothetical protein ASD89_00035 [Caulobacter sp. Root656]
MVGKFGKLAIAIGMAALVVGVALSIRSAHQPPPVFPMPEAAPVSAGDAMSPAEIEADRRRNLAFERDQETAPFARWPGVARREGDVLIIRAGDRDAASFTDTGYCDGFDQCARWRFRGVWRLGGWDYPWLTFFHGEGEETAYIIDARGQLFAAQGEPLASPDGRWLVVAYDDPDTQGAVTVFEAGASGLRLAAFSDVASCRAEAWKSGARLAMICTDSDPMKGQRPLAADLVRGARGWRIEPSAELDAKTRQPLAQPTRPLVDVELTTSKDHGAPESDAYEVEKGYRRL